MVKLGMKEESLVDDYLFKTFGAKNIKEQIVSQRIKKREESIKLDTSKMMFGIMKPIFWGLCLILVIFLYRISIFIFFTGKNEVCSNLVKISANTLDEFNTYVGIFSAVVNLVVWNGESPYWENDPTIPINVFSKRMTEHIIPLWEESQYYDVGNLTEYYREHLIVSSDILTLLESSMRNFLIH